MTHTNAHTTHACARSLNVLMGPVYAATIGLPTVAPLRVRAEAPESVAPPKVPATTSGHDTVAAPKVAPAPIVTEVKPEIAPPLRVGVPFEREKLNAPEPDRPPVTIRLAPALLTLAPERAHSAGHKLA